MILTKTGSMAVRLHVLQGCHCSTFLLIEIYSHMTSSHVCVDLIKEDKDLMCVIADWAS